MTGEQDNTYNFIITVHNITLCDYLAREKEEPTITVVSHRDVRQLGDAV